MQAHRTRTLRHRVLVVAVAGLMAIQAGCQATDHAVEVMPRLIGGGQAVSLPMPAPRPADAPQQPLPPEQPTDGFTFEAAGTDERGWPQYTVQIGRGGSPYLVAVSKLTPLFQVDGQGPIDYVSAAYFAAHPDRTATSIQPGDEFTLTVPPGTFIVRWQEDRDENFGRPARVREYVSEAGDRLLLYLTERFPILREQVPAATPGYSTITLHPDLAYLLGSGQLDPLTLARLIYRVQDPDMFQAAATRKLAAAVKPGESLTLGVDRTRSYLDPIREAMTHADHTEALNDPDLPQMTRATFRRDQGFPFAAIDDAVGTRTTLDEIPDGLVFRIEYDWDGTVSVSYKTGEDDERGKRDPYAHRDNAGWTGLYSQFITTDDAPIKWGTGEPSDMDPFPTARDPRRTIQDGERSYDYLISGRVVLLTFKPIRTLADAKAQADFRSLLSELRDRYKDDLTFLMEYLGSFEPDS
ncbi:MAG: hypothetical protein IT305_05105 [Chloroflexi bacterium]|nr:hypothetical protein [Chloroflexota bacterium]